MKFISKLVISVLILLMFFAIAGAEGLAKAIKLKSYDLAFVDLDHPVTITGDDGKTATYEQGYLIRLHGDFPIHGASIMRLFFGDEAIAEYGGLPDGLYFMIYEKDRMKRLAGKELRYQIDDGSIISFKVRFDPRRFEPFTPQKYKTALTR